MFIDDSGYYQNTPGVFESFPFQLCNRIPGVFEISIFLLNFH